MIGCHVDKREKKVPCPRCNSSEDLFWCMLCDGKGQVHALRATAYTLRFGEEWPDTTTVWRFLQTLFSCGAEPCLPNTPEVASVLNNLEVPTGGRLRRS